MSAIETVQKAYAAFGQGDMEALTTLVSDDYLRYFLNQCRMGEHSMVQMISFKIV